VNRETSCHLSEHLYLLGQLLQYVFWGFPNATFYELSAHSTRIPAGHVLWLFPNQASGIQSRYGDSRELLGLVGLYHRNYKHKKLANILLSSPFSLLGLCVFV
jgi:hypothetical protein